MNSKYIIASFLLFSICVSCAQQVDNNTSLLVVQSVGGEGLLFGQKKSYIINEDGRNKRYYFPQEISLTSCPEWSPDGNWIAYIGANENPKFSSDDDIYAMSISGNKNIRLTDNADYFYNSIGCPTWAPDGNTIAFDASIAKSQAAIYLKNVECIYQGIECSLNAQFLILGGSPNWSPDGQRIVFYSPNGIAILDLRNPEDPIVISDYGDLPKWSPDGKRIVFSSEGAIYLIDATGTGLKYLVTGRAPIWSPDGNEIIFIGNKANDPNLGVRIDIEGMFPSTAVFSINVDGTNLHRLTKSNKEVVFWITWMK